MKTRVTCPIATKVSSEPDVLADERTGAVALGDQAAVLVVVNNASRVLSMPFDYWPSSSDPEDEPGTYPYFMPPDHLATKPWKDWTAREAEFFLQWLLRVVPDRLDALFVFFCESRVGTANDVLLRVGLKAEAALKTPEFSRTQHPDESVPADQALKNRGYALGADLGFLVATHLVEVLEGKVEWTIFRKNRRWFPHNHPVLRSRVVDCNFDMIWCALTGCFGILDGTHTGRFWADLFAVWHNLLLYNDTRGLSLNPADRKLE